MISYLKGNLLEAPTQALVNTVNTIGVMGKGIALQCKEAFPNNHKAYVAACKKGEFKIGKLLVVKDHNAIHGTKYLINFPTKKHWLYPSKYEYIAEGLQDLVKVIEEYSIKSVALPALGCGNGGLNWDRVKAMINDYLSKVNANILVYEPNANIKLLLQKQGQEKAMTLTDARAMLLYALFHYEVLGEYSSLFSANKLAYFLHRMGEMQRLKFVQHYYGPYAVGVDHVLYALNGIYLQGLEQRQAKPFEPLVLNYDRLPQVTAFVEQKLAPTQRAHLEQLTNLIDGFQSNLALEILASVAYLLEQKPDLSFQDLFSEIRHWNARKCRLFKEHKENYVRIAYQHLTKAIHEQWLFA